jgi:NAD(P)-dependent dehydrogenase (short-subunit alcohol dehydrogenase family)
MNRLQDKVAFITGAGSGIGRAAANLFAREGAKVIVAEISEHAGQATADELRGSGGVGLFVPTDITRLESVEHALGVGAAHFGRIDILYNNAGGSTPRDRGVTDTPVEEFWRVIGVDLFGTWSVCKFGIPHLARAGGGAIINVTSMIAFMGIGGKDSYTAAKGGISALTRSLAVNYAKDKIRVNAIAPGMVGTERGKRNMAAGATPKWLVDRHLLGPIEPVEVAYMALFLASDEALRITGQIFHVDSGATIS